MLLVFQALIIWIMKRLVGILIVSICTASGAWAMQAAAKFSTSAGEKIQVYLNGKMINKSPKSVVYIKGRPGVHKVRIKVYNQAGNFKYSYLDWVSVTSGFRTEFTLSKEKHRSIKLKQTGIKRIYDRSYQRLDKFYNQKLLTSNEKAPVMTRAFSRYSSLT